MPGPFPSYLKPSCKGRGRFVGRLALTLGLVALPLGLLASPLGVAAEPTTSPTSSPTPSGDLVSSSPEQRPRTSEPTNLALLKRQLASYHDSGAYERDVEQMTLAAQRYMTSRLRHATRPALVLDLDDTAISNWNWLASRDFVLDATAFGDWCRQAQAPALAPVARLFAWARAHQVAVFFVVGRRESSRSETERQLLAAGYQGYQQVYYKPHDYKEASVAIFKAQARRAIASQGYTILANVGDQDSDLEGGGAEQSYKLPNPMYLVP